MINTYAFFFQAASAFVSFTSALTVLLLYRKTGFRFLLHSTLVLASFMLMSFSSLGWVLDILLGTTVDLDSTYFSLTGFIVSVLIAGLFIPGISGLSLDLVPSVRVARYKRVRIMYTILVCFAYIPLHLSLNYTAAVNIYNILVIWFPTVLCLLYALIHIKAYIAGTYTSERKLFLFMSAINVVCAVLGVFYPVFLTILPFIFILCSSVMVIVLASIHFFSPAQAIMHTGPIEIAPAFIEIYHITAREQDIIKAVLEGKSNKDIADQLCVSLKTVETHLRNIFRKTGAQSRLALFSLLSRSPAGLP